jgi:hypothetical protein
MNAPTSQPAPVARIGNAQAKAVKFLKGANLDAAQAVQVNAPKTMNVTQVKSATRAPASVVGKGVKRNSTAPWAKCATTDIALKTPAAFPISNVGSAKCAET